jgi:hypothetical protein
MVRIKEYLQHHRPVVVLIGITLILITVPFLQIRFVLGDSWQGILPNFTDELNFARVHTIGEGHLTNGNAYFLEHSDGPPLVIFGGAWINAIPLLAGIPFNTAMAINFVIWSLLFTGFFYWLLRELRVLSWVSVVGAAFLYIQSFMHMWRPVNLQPVYPFFFLFYIALFRLIHEQSRKNILLLAFTTGAGFYIFAYLWQIAVITLGLLFLYALIRKNWPLLKATLLSSCIGGVIGLPVPLYALWLSYSSPYFWESVGRLGLVNTHLPMAEVIYSGGWIGVVVTLLAIFFWRAKMLREDREFVLLALFLVISGLGLWVMQGSNLITGKLLETGEHVVSFIMPWLVFSTLSLGVFLWKRSAQLSKGLLLFSAGVLLALSVVSIGYSKSFPFWISDIERSQWQTAQLYAEPYAWLQANEENPVVVWSNPSDLLTTNLPVFTRHFTLYTYFGMLELVPEGEIRERYLISQYFNNPSIADLENVDNMKLYLGRHDFPHQAKTIERGIKICRILFFWDKNKDCGTPPTSAELLGEKFFSDLENKFQTDIKPNIKAYLKKYHVAYILKDKMLDSQYHPEKLGAVMVYTDNRYEIWKF